MPLERLKRVGMPASLLKKLLADLLAGELKRL
jgi:hypothetical protein